MSLRDFQKDFFVRAVLNARKIRMKKLADLETQLMVVEGAIYRKSMDPTRRRQVLEVLAAMKAEVRAKRLA